MLGMQSQGLKEILRKALKRLLCGTFQEWLLGTQGVRAVVTLTKTSHTGLDEEVMSVLVKIGINNKWVERIVYTHLELLTVRMK